MRSYFVCSVQLFLCVSNKIRIISNVYTYNIYIYISTDLKNVKKQKRAT